MSFNWPTDDLTIKEKVGIGTDTPTEKLDVKGNIKLNAGVAVGEFSTDGTLATASNLSVPTTQAVKTYVSTTLTNKADKAGSLTQDFQTKNLTAQGNLEVTGTTTFRSPVNVTGTVTATNFVGDGSRLTGLGGGTQWVNGSGGSISYSGGNVGIGTTTPTQAKLEINGTGGNTMGIFGSNRQGISLVADWPSIGFNAYFSGVWKSLVPGWTGNIYVHQDAGGIGFQIGQKSTAANENITLVERFSIGADGLVSIPGRLNFGAQVRQMINLWNTDYGIGVQSGTTYFRSSDNFCWFKGGTHNDSRDNPGGGVRLMALNGAGDLILSARTNPAGNPRGSFCRALVDAGNKLVVNFDNDYAQGVDIVNGRFVSSRQLKDNIADLSLEEATNALSHLNPVRFSYKSDFSENLHVGFIAEDIPELLAAPDKRSIGALDVVAVLTKVVQQQQSAIATLKDQIQNLESIVGHHQANAS
jgi:hypothetical protein